MKVMTSLMMMVVLASALHAQLVIPQPTQSPFGAHPLTVSLPPLVWGEGHTFGDFDGDGEVDMLCRMGGNLLWQRNMGNGIFGQYQFGSSLAIMGLIYGWAHDFDRDGLTDVIAVNTSSPFSVQLLLRSLTSITGFSPPIPVLPPQLSVPPITQSGVFLGLPFLPSGEMCGLRTSVNLTTIPQPNLPFHILKFDRATLGFQLVASGTIPADVVYFTILSPERSIDLNSDGHPDFVMGKYALSGSNQPVELIPMLSVPNTNGVYSFVEGQRLIDPAMSKNTADGLRVDDMNGDGIPDLVGLTPDIVVWYGNGNGGFLPQQTVHLAQSFTYHLPEFEILDINLDGIKDVVVVGNVPDASIGLRDRVLVSVYPGRPGGVSFGEPQVMSAFELTQPQCGPSPLCGQLSFANQGKGRADFDRDGDLDIGFWASNPNGAPERYGFVRNDTIAAKGCSFSGPVPQIDVGPTTNGSSGVIGLRRAPPGDQAYLLASTATQSYAACGGLIPNLNNLLGPQGVFYAATVSDAGTASFSYTLPPSATPINATIYLQWVVTDAANPFAIRLTDLRKAILW
jgi:hypothetical protein